MRQTGIWQAAKVENFVLLPVFVDILDVQISDDKFINCI